ncbi:MAG: preprotein translocase subunit SecE [Pseudomonadota bacterium]|nr:preprotein translocase subunit SecE [Pseudomonadota bacterium]
MSISMVAKKTPNSMSKDIFIWILVSVLAVACSYFLYSFDEKYGVFRVLLSLALFGGLSFISTYTSQGLQLSSFLQTSYSEMRLVVWPSKEEVSRLSVVIVISVIVVSLLLWFLDSTLTRIFSFFLGQ